MSNKITDEDIVKLIRIVALNPKTLDVWIDASAKRLAILGKKDLKIDKKKLSEVLTGFDFLKQFASVFKKTFSEKEISSLIKIYQTSEMQKMHQHSVELFEPLYKGMNAYIDKVLS